MIGITVVIIGLALFQSSPSRHASVISSGPFTIHSTIEPSEDPGYGPYKKVELSWKTPDGVLSYDLTDDGQFVRASYGIARDKSSCSVLVTGSNPEALLPLTNEPSFYFNSKNFFGNGVAGCLPTSARKLKGLRRATIVLDAAFSAAFAEWRAAAERLHGPSTRRCEKLDDNLYHHGPSCDRYFSETR